MLFQVNSDIQYYALLPSTLVLNIHALRASHQVVMNEVLTVTPSIKVEKIKSGSKLNRFFRLEVEQGVDFTVSYQATVDTSFKLLDQEKGPIGTSIRSLDGEVLPYLFPSRYCQSDKLQRLAHNQFGHIENAYLQVIAITDWIYQNVEYLGGSTNSETSAYDTVTERAGVCRDFAHLGIALCRALCIPARYYTGYAYRLIPQDFHACFEAYISGSWLIFDATRLAPLNGLVKIATGRDAADAAIASIFGNVACHSVNVQCEALEEDFVPYFYQDDSFIGLSYQ
jgi:transglutaminase-like putative cysteine protease